MPTGIPKPTALKKLEGDRNKGKSPINRREPKPRKLSDLSPPAFLSPEAVKIWEQLAPEFHAMGILCGPDVVKFATYCADIAWSIKLRKQIDEEGFRTKGVTKKGQAYEMTNGLPQLLNTILTRIDNFGKQFGDSPQARVKLFGGDGDEEKEQGGLMGFLAKRQPAKALPQPPQPDPVEIKDPTSAP